MLRFPDRPTTGRAAFEERVTVDVTAVEPLAGDEDWSAVGDYIRDHAAWSSGGTCMPGWFAPSSRSSLV